MFNTWPSRSCARLPLLACHQVCITYSKVCFMQFKVPAGNTFQAIWLAGGHVIRTNAFMNCSVIQYAIMLGTWCTQYSSTTYMTTTIIGVSLSEPNIDHDNGPCVRNNAIYLSMYMHHLLRICHTLVPEIRVCPECPVLFGILTCSCAFTTVLNWTAKTTGATRVCRQDYKTGRGMCRHMV